ncbi:MAG: 4-(cytidine 5'-diphospho)-2-C-methyl-D-erythritol kinase [Chloroflexota bacterium]
MGKTHAARARVAENMIGWQVLAPAKINLGLEIIGRRADGYHEIATIMQAITIFDRLTLRPAQEWSFSLDAGDRTGDLLTELSSDRNLVLRAAWMLEEKLGLRTKAAIHLHKRIPVAAGLGGASSDAAACLLGLCALDGIFPARPRLNALAAELGSDVAFFLSGGTAYATGRGEVLTPLPRSRFAWFVVVAPVRRLEQKTATMYALLRDEDFSSGDRTERLAALIRQGVAPEPCLLQNSFARAVTEAFPETRVLQGALTAAGAPFVALSGAGPAHYTAVQTIRDALSVAMGAQTLLGPGFRVMVCRAAGGPVMRDLRTTV